jgi:hypothetical protein
MKKQRVLCDLRTFFFDTEQAENKKEQKGTGKGEKERKKEKMTWFRHYEQ